MCYSCVNGPSEYTNAALKPINERKKNYKLLPKNDKVAVGFNKIYTLPRQTYINGYIV